MHRLTNVPLCAALLLSTALAFAPPGLRAVARPALPSSARCAAPRRRAIALRMNMGERERLQMEMEKAVSDERYGDAARFRDELKALGDAPQPAAMPTPRVADDLGMTRAEAELARLENPGFDEDGGAVRAPPQRSTSERTQRTARGLTPRGTQGASGSDAEALREAARQREIERLNSRDIDPSGDNMGTPW